MIKPWINFAFLYQPERIEFLKIALKALSEWPVNSLMILITINRIDKENSFTEELSSIHKNIVIKSVNVDNFDPRILQWDHKNYLQEFLDSDYTHFIYADADLVLNFHVLDYWIKTSEMFKKHGFKRFIPGTFRFENYCGSIRSVDTTYRTDIPTLKLVMINNQTFFSPQEPFQGISIMDTELAFEHLKSRYSGLNSIGVHGFGYGETAISAYIFENPPEGFIHRILIPLDDYEKCWIQHLPNNYAANAFKEHGKIHAHTMFQNIKKLTR